MKRIFGKILSVRPVNPQRITILYVVLSLIWIIFSDKIVIRSDLNHFYISLFSTLKGILFVLITAALLFIMIKNAIKYTEQQIEKNRQSEKVYKLLSENINDVVWLFDVKTMKIKYVSPSIIKQRGFTPEEIYEQDYRDSVTEELKEFLEEEIKTRISKFESGDLSQRNKINELKQPCKDGSTIHARITTSMISDANGKVTEICGRAENITDLYVTQNALNALAVSFSFIHGEEFYVKVSEHISKSLNIECVYIAKLSNDKSFLSVLGGFRNGISFSSFNYPIENSPCELVVRNSFQTFNNDVQKLFPLDEMLKEMNAESYMGSLLTDSNNNSLGLIVAIDSRPIPNPNLAPLLFKIFSERVVTEIEKTQAEESSKQSEERYYQLFEANKDSIAIFGINENETMGNFLECNESTLELLGYTREELLKLTPDCLERKVNPETFLNRKKELQKFGSATFETILTDKSGKDIDVEVKAILFLYNQRPAIMNITRDISERRRNEQALKEIESKYELISRNSADVIWILNLEQKKIEYISPSVEKLLGFTPEEVYQHSIKDGLIPESYDFVTQSMPERIRAFYSGEVNAKTTITEMGQYHKNGSVVYIEAMTTLIPDADGKINRILGVSRDITERKKTQEELMRSEANLTTAMKIARLGHWEYDVATNLFTFNDQFYNLLNTSYAELGTYSFTPEEYAKRFLHPDDRFMVEVETQKALETRDPNYTSILEHRVIFGDGTIGYISVNINIVKDEFGKTIKTYGVNQDITEKRLSQEAIRESEERYKELYDLSPDAIVVHQNGKILFINPAGLKIVGADSETEIVGKNLLEFVHPDYRKIVLDRVDRMSRTNEPVKPRYEKFLRLNGESVDVEVSSTPITLKGKIAYQVIARDITERKMIEDILHASEEKFSKIFENAPVMITISTLAEPHYIDANQMCYELTGFSRDEILGKVTSQMGWITAEDQKKIIDEINLSGNVRNLSIKLFTKDQRALDCLCFCEVIYVQEEKCLLSIFLDITERKRANELIAESEQKLSALIEATPDIICFKDAEGRWLKANQGILKVYGLSNFDYSFKTEWDMAAYTRENLQDAFRTCSLTDELAWLKGSHSRTEEMIPDQDNNPRFFDVIKVPLFYENGNRKALVVFGRDITERKKSEQALRSEKDKFSKTFFTSPDGLVINRLDDSVIIELNNGFLGLTGYMRDELLNKKSRSFNLWVDNEKRKESKNKLLTDGSYQDLETELRKKDGGFINVLVSAARIDVDGTACVLYLIKDITKLKEAEKALIESEEKYRELFDHLMDGFVYHELIVDEEGNPVDCIFLAANPQYEILTGLKLNEIIGKSVYEIMPAKAKAYIETYAPVAITCEPKRFESFNEDTGIHFKVLAYSPERYKFATIIENITDKILAETELKLYRSNLEQLVKLRTIELDSINNRLQDELRKGKEYEMMLQEALKKEKELSELKTRFISTASHEFRTPLTSILSSTELIERYRKKWDDTKFNEHFSRVKNSVEYLTKLLDDVLLISRTDSGKVSFNPSVIILKEFCEEVLREAAVYSKENHSITFIYQTKRKKYLLDGKLLKFILVNIISNAYKYSPKGGIVEFTVKNNKSNLIFTVRDQGIGIPEDERDHLFEPFHRSKNSKDIPGTGLGLSIVKRSLDLHKGRISLESALNKGTLITIYLPINISDEEELITN